LRKIELEKIALAAQEELAYVNKKQDESGKSDDDDD
jgi:hypothetical protein